MSKEQEEAIALLTELAVEKTDRKQRLTNTQSSFLGEKEGTIKDGNGTYDEFFNSYPELIEQCYQAYQKVCSEI